MIMLQGNQNEYMSTPSSEGAVADSDEPPLLNNLEDEDASLDGGGDNDPPLSERLQTIADSFQLLIDQQISVKSIAGTSLVVMRGSVPSRRTLNAQEKIVKHEAESIGLTIGDIMQLRFVLQSSTNHVTKDVRRIIDILFLQRYTTFY